MGILTLYHRFGAVGAFAVVLHAFGADIHGAVDVGVVGISGTLVLHRAALVHGLDGFVGGDEVHSVAGLVAEAPEDDAGVVVVACHVALVALNVGFFELGEFGE